jgi:magnesium transporter
MRQRVMNRPAKRVSQKAGLPPGTLVHIGETRAETTRIQVMDYDAERCEERELASLEEGLPRANGSGVVWVNIVGLHQVDIIERIGNHFNWHPLMQEDVLNAIQRPKLDDYDDYLCIILKRLSVDAEKDRLKTEQISLVLGPNYVISFQEGVSEIFDPVRERIRKGKGRIRRCGADYLGYSLLDAVVDSYFVILEKVGDAIEDLEEDLLSNPKVETSHRVHHLRRELIFLRRCVWPLREVISTMERGDSPLIQDKTRVYLKDVYDHTVEVIETVESFREMVSGMVEVYLSSLSHRLNEVMKVLTIIATLFIPLTFVAGVYGMNFKYMPELEWKLGYALFWLIIILVGGSMLLYFRKRKWL